MKGKPDIGAFLDGSSADVAEKPKPKAASKVKVAPPPVKAKVYKEQKLYRLSSDVTEALREKVYELTKAEGRRVTETEIVEQAIRKYLAI